MRLLLVGRRVEVRRLRTACRVIYRALHAHAAVARACKNHLKAAAIQASARTHKRCERRVLATIDHKRKRRLG